jgi:hypothetical protein
VKKILLIISNDSAIIDLVNDLNKIIPANVIALPSHSKIDSDEANGFK